MNIREAIRASGGLVSLTEAGDRAGLSRERMRQYTEKEGFPTPIHKGPGQTSAKLYLAVEIEQWLRDYRSGQPQANGASLEQFERGFS